MALLILAHPSFTESVANKTIVDELSRTQADLEIRHIHDLYPDYQIDIAAEQSALLRHELIILQCPMYWFSIPAILKIWFDQVFTHQFAYGSKGDKLKNKKLLLSMTIGQPEQNFSTEQQHSLLEDFLSPIQKSALYTGMEYLEPVFLYDISTVLGHTHAEIRTRAKQHSLKLNHYLQTIDSN